MADDLLIFNRHPETIIKPLEKTHKYELKQVGIPEFYSGADIEYLPNKKCWSMSAKTYILEEALKIGSFITNFI